MRTASSESVEPDKGSIKLESRMLEDDDADAAAAATAAPPQTITTAAETKTDVDTIKL